MKPLDEAMRRADMAAQMADLNSPRRGIEKYAEVRQAVLASLAADGWELVPRVATDDMLATGKIAAMSTHRVDQVYESMVSAAPKLGETP